MNTLAWISVKQPHANPKLNSCFKETNSAKEFTWARTLVKGFPFHHCKSSVWFSPRWEFLKTSAIWLVLCSQYVRGSRVVIWGETPCLKFPKCLYVPLVPKVKSRWTTGPWERVPPGMAHRVVDTPSWRLLTWQVGLLLCPHLGCWPSLMQVPSDAQGGGEATLCCYSRSSIDLRPWVPPCVPFFQGNAFSWECFALDGNLMQ